ncbi:putative Uncharacterized oxidoreductase T05C12.3 [Glarea lozoyensis 74030]|nr:putative Uncharacterized oxidoreductase T05C12.3 [Glarea lozoyensis 74030]
MSKTILLLGAGKMVGEGIASHFHQAGYKVALASRSGNFPWDTKNSYLHVKADFADPSSVEGVFQKVKTEYGVPNVVVYNTAIMTPTPQPTSESVAAFETGIKSTIVSGYAAAKYALEGFRTLPSEVSKTFIWTGNGLNVKPVPVLFNLGVGKAGAASIVQTLAAAYGNDGFKFYYADERKPDGGFISQEISGENHGKFYLKLAEGAAGVPWDATFVGSEY